MTNLPSPRSLLHALPTLSALVCTGSFAGNASAVVINEIVSDTSGGDEQYVELFGTPGESLAGLSFVVIGDSTDGGSGVVDLIVPLDGFQIGTNGYFLMANPRLVAETDIDYTGPIDLSLDVFSGNFLETGDTTAYLLVSGFTGADQQDLDTDDINSDTSLEDGPGPGLLELLPWTSIIDGVSAIDGNDPNLDYSAQLGIQALPGTNPIFPPAHIFRDPEGTGAFATNDFGTGPFTPTAGGPSTVVPEPSSLALAVLGLGALGLRRRR